MSGTEGYEAEAASLFARYDGKPFAEVHRHLLPLLPAGRRALDIGAGTGRDAAGLAALGFDVLAVEPTAAFRTRAAVLHPSPRITWLDDRLPDLALVAARGERFDVVMLTAVWMHLDAAQRAAAMPMLARLLRPAGVLSLTLRHGPVPRGRRMFDVHADEVVAMAADHGVSLRLRLDAQPGRPDQPGVTWTRLVFQALAEAGEHPKPPTSGHADPC
jgi:SAM-dependent methyltransferase